MLQIPPYIGNPVELRKLNQLVERNAGQKEKLGYFRGSIGGNSDSKKYSGGIRQQLFHEKQELKQLGIEIYGDHTAPETYLKEMSKTTFCLCPAGWMSWSPRLFQAMAVGCIPVVIGPDSALPFNLQVDILFVKAEDVGNLGLFLESFTEQQVLEIQRRISSVWHFFTYNAPGAPFEDAFDLVLQTLGPDKQPLSPDGSVLDDLTACISLPASNSSTVQEVSVNPHEWRFIAQAHVEKFNVHDSFELVL